MGDRDLIINQIRQRLEILYQMVEELEQSGGGGGGEGGTTNYNELSNKPSIEGITLVGNQSAASLGLATVSQLSQKVDKVAGCSLMTEQQALKLQDIEMGAEVNVQADWNQTNPSADSFIKNKPTIPDLTNYYNKTQTDSLINTIFTPDSVSVEDGQSLPSSIQSFLTAHKPIEVNSTLYYFVEETGVDYLYQAVPPSGAFPSLSYLRIMKNGLRAEFYVTRIETTPTSGSDNLVTSGGIYTKNAQQDTAIASILATAQKNYAEITATTQTQSGVTFTINSDGTVTLNGTNTSSGNIIVVLGAPKLPAGSYTLSGCPSGGSGSTFELSCGGGGLSKTNDYGSGANFTLASETQLTYIQIVVRANQSFTNTVFKPMICTQAAYQISSDFVPYAPTNRQLYEMIKALQ